MGSFPSPYHLVLLNTRFGVPERRLLFPSARLFFDRIELTGWHLHERYEEVLPLATVTEIDWEPERSTTGVEANVVFHLEDGRTLPLQLDQRASWRHTLENRLSWRARQRSAARAMV